MEKETGFWPAIKDFACCAGDFKGVVLRRQYWWVCLAQALQCIEIGFVRALTGSILTTTTQLFGESKKKRVETLLFMVPMYLSYPQLSLTRWRCCDAKENPWWYLVLV